MSLHIIKLVVGIDDLETLFNWQENNSIAYKGQKAYAIHTRYKPRRAEEILESSGSIYRVIKGRILCRQKVLGFEQEESSKRGKHCLILIDSEIIRTSPMPYKPFQGWRYIEQSRVPEDVGTYTVKSEEGEFEEGLRELGVL